MKNYKNKIRIIGLFAVILILLIIYKNYNPLNHFFPKCPINYSTGFYCPGCGSQRAIHFLLNLSFFQAFSQNILVVLFIFIFTIDVLFSILGMEKFRPYSILKSSNHFAKIILLVIITFTILRNVPIYPFTILAPNTCEIESEEDKNHHHIHNHK